MLREHRAGHSLLESRKEGQVRIAPEQQERDPTLAGAQATLKVVGAPRKCGQPESQVFLILHLELNRPRPPLISSLVTSLGSHFG